MTDKNYIKLSKSNLFNKDWYLGRYKDVEYLSMDPIKHFLKYGLLLERDPGPDFSTKLYLDAHTDVKRAGINPLLHFLDYGRNEHRIIFKVDGTSYFARENLEAIERRKNKLGVSILYHSHNLKWQGAPNSLYEISKGINRLKEFNVELMSPDAGPLSSEYYAEKIPAHLFQFPSRGIPNDQAKFNHYLAKLSAKYNELEIDVVHANTLQTYFSVIAAKIAGIPVVWNIRESEDPIGYFNYLPSYLRHKAFNSIAMAEKVVFVANSTMQLWKQHFDGENFELITNGVDVKRLHYRSYGINKADAKLRFGIPLNNLVVLSVGTVDKRKNQMELLKSYYKCVNEGLKNCSLLIIGMNGNEYSTKVRECAININSIGGHVVLVDETSSARGLTTTATAYSAADVFCLNSLVESYPRVVVEAFSYSLPVIASRCFGTVEQINHCVDGFLYDLGDISKLSCYITSLCADHGLRKQMSRAAFRRINNLNTYPVMIEKYNRIYRELVNG